MNLVISKIGPESDFLLRNLSEIYCHDMSEWFELDTGTDGRYSYDTASVWANGHHAYLAKVGDSIAGFALIGSGSEWLGDVGAHDVHEFFIMRKFRRRGVGRSMATFLWNAHPGDWLVRVLEANAPAVTFWRSGISIYSLDSYNEEQHIVEWTSLEILPVRVEWGLPAGLLVFVINRQTTETFYCSRWAYSSENYPISGPDQGQKQGTCSHRTL